jgi:UDP-glucose 4-epimerase
MSNSHSLVTGGAGFIGSHLADHLIAKGHSVVVLDDLSGGFRDHVNRQARFVEGSILDSALINDLFQEFPFSYVFHAAAYAAEGLSHFIKRFNYQNNVIGSVNLINAAVNHNVKCFVFTSSIAVYGENQLPMNESMTPKPEDSYGIAKYSVEMELEITRRLFGLDYIIFRPHNVYGERQNVGDRYRNVLGIFMNQILHDEPMSVFGDGLQTRAFTHIDDVAPMIVQSIENREAYNEIFNIGSDIPFSVLELGKKIATEFGRKAEFKYYPSRVEVKHAYSDHTKAAKILGYNPRIGIDEGIRRMVTWVQQTGCRESRAYEGIEIRKNLPEAWVETPGSKSVKI